MKQFVIASHSEDESHGNNASQIDIEDHLEYASQTANEIQINIDDTKIDENLTDFPILLHLSGNSGINGFDASGIFKVLKTNDEFDPQTRLMLRGNGDVSDSQHPLIVTGDPQVALL